MDCMKWLAAVQNLYSETILLAIGPLCEIGYGLHATANNYVFEQITAESYNHETFHYTQFPICDKYMY